MVILNSTFQIMPDDPQTSTALIVNSHFDAPAILGCEEVYANTNALERYFTKTVSSADELAIFPLHGSTMSIFSNSKCR